MLLTDQEFIIKKAKSKKDGCYQIRGIAYRVRDGFVTHFATGFEIYERCYGFLCVSGEVNHPYNCYSTENCLKALKSIKGA